PRPVVGDHFLADLQAIVQQRVSLRPPRLPEQATTERGEITGQQGALVRRDLAPAGNRLALQAHGRGPTAEPSVGCGQVVAAARCVGVVRAQLGLHSWAYLVEEPDRS